jgi:hypothetical protein
MKNQKLSVYTNRFKCLAHGMTMEKWKNNIAKDLDKYVGES